MKKAVSIISTTMLVLVLLVAFALVGVRLFGIEPYTVLSGSMEPTYHVGALIYVKEVDVTTLQVGDPVTYIIEGETVVTHRIVEIIPNYSDSGLPGFKTKGDNNRIVDGTPVHSKNVLGKPVFDIPLLGYVAYYVQNPPGSYLAVGFCIVIALLTFVPDLVDKLLQEDPPPDGKPPGDAPPDETPSAMPPSAAPSDASGDKKEHPPNS